MLTGVCHQPLGDVSVAGSHHVGKGQGMIQVSGVFHHFGLRPVLIDVNLTVESGRTLAIIGPNGMGKTTLLNIMAGVLSPAEGMVWINGLQRRSSAEYELLIRKRTMYLPAEIWIPHGITGRDLVLGVGETWGVDNRRLFDHTDRLLKVFQMDRIADAAVSGYSSGQKKKIGLCAALVSDASILLLDEPFSGGLDPAGLTAMKEILKHLTSCQDRTVVLTSPVPELVEEVADDVLILDGGRVLKHAPVRDVIRDSGAVTLNEALRKLIFPETEGELQEYFLQERTV